jgi:hypothetical protein
VPTSQLDIRLQYLAFLSGQESVVYILSVRYQMLLCSLEPSRSGPVRISKPARSCHVMMDVQSEMFAFCTVRGTSTPLRHQNTETFPRVPVCLVHVHLFLSTFIFLYLFVIYLTTPSVPHVI